MQLIIPINFYFLVELGSISMLLTKHNYNNFYSFTHSFIHTLFIYHFSCTRYCAGSHEYNTEQDRHSLCSLEFPEIQEKSSFEIHRILEKSNYVSFPHMVQRNESNHFSVMLLTPHSILLFY